MYSIKLSFKNEGEDWGCSSVGKHLSSVFNPYHHKKAKAKQNLKINDIKPFSDK
jgi:hypothetical protein